MGVTEQLEQSATQLSRLRLAVANLDSALRFLQSEKVITAEQREAALLKLAMPDYPI